MSLTKHSLTTQINLGGILMKYENTPRESGGTEMFKVGDIVFVANPDTEYEEEYGIREHRSFFGKVTEVTEYKDETCVEVEFPSTPNGCAMKWS